MPGREGGSGQGWGDLVCPQCQQVASWGVKVDRATQVLPHQRGAAPHSKAGRAFE